MCRSSRTKCTGDGRDRHDANVYQAIRRRDTVGLVHAELGEHKEPARDKGTVYHPRYSIESKRINTDSGDLVESL